MRPVRPVIRNPDAPPGRSLVRFPPAIPVIGDDLRYEVAPRVSGRSDPVTKKIIKLAKEEERDLRRRAIEALRDVPPGAAAEA
jgi:hypothetical protein